MVSFDVLSFFALLPLMVPSCMLKVPLYTYTPPWGAVLPLTLAVLFISNLPLFTLPPVTFTYTPPPFFASLPLMVPPFMVKVPPFIYTPAPELPLLSSVLLLVTLDVPYMLKVPLYTYTPPPWGAVFLVMLPPYILKVPPLSTFTPQPATPEACVTLPLLFWQSVRVSVAPDWTSNTGIPLPSLWIVLPFRQMVTLSWITMGLSIVTSVSKPSPVFR